MACQSIICCAGGLFTETRFAARARDVLTSREGRAGIEAYGVMETRQKSWIAPTEACIGAVLSIMLAAVVVSCGSKKTVDGAIQNQIVYNAKQILAACDIYAADRGGVFPIGKFDPTLERITSDEPADSAEPCFTDLLEVGAIDFERTFWSTVHKVQCGEEEPDENDELEADENCWDYVVGMDKVSAWNLPVVFEASDDGEGKQWTEEGGHPWSKEVVVGYKDGSVEKVKLDERGRLRTVRGEKKVDLCVPTPGTDGWPKLAKLAPATPAG